MPKSNGEPYFCERYERFKADMVTYVKDSSRGRVPYSDALRNAQSLQETTFGRPFREHRKMTRQTLSHLCANKVSVLRHDSNLCLTRLPSSAQAIRLESLQLEQA